MSDDKTVAFKDKNISYNLKFTSKDKNMPIFRWLNVQLL